MPHLVLEGIVEEEHGPVPVLHDVGRVAQADAHTRGRGDADVEREPVVGGAGVRPDVSAGLQDRELGPLDVDPRTQVCQHVAGPRKNISSAGVGTVVLDLPLLPAAGARLLDELGLVPPATRPAAGDGGQLVPELLDQLRGSEVVLHAGKLRRISGRPPSLGEELRSVERCWPLQWIPPQPPRACSLAGNTAGFLLVAEPQQHLDQLRGRGKARLALRCHIEPVVRL
mmetsp:Transcript_87698/g.261543  ORF Transcript_87698/g.261543 Transcript_87698/m.261543 type:complete len:227 (-) Transcript_87698:174-854(-)